MSDNAKTLLCPQCSLHIVEGQKFCGKCGCLLTGLWSSGSLDSQKDKSSFIDLDDIDIDIDVDDKNGLFQSIKLASSCSKCGNPIGAHNFCGKCGTQLGDVAPPERANGFQPETDFTNGSSMPQLQRQDHYPVNQEPPKTDLFLIWSIVNTLFFSFLGLIPLIMVMRLRNGSIREAHAVTKTVFLIKTWNIIATCVGVVIIFSLWYINFIIDYFPISLQ